MELRRDRRPSTKSTKDDADAGVVNRMEVISEGTAAGERDGVQDHVEMPPAADRRLRSLGRVAPQLYRRWQGG